jgi:DNA-binding response OmpR family regulator
MSPRLALKADPSQAKRAKVLVIEDEPDLREAIVSYLALEAIDAKGVGTLAEADAWRVANDFDIVVLDLGLPDGDGVRWLEAAPAVGLRGVIMLTARGAPAQRVTGLRAGADAYLVKPVALEELALTIRNLFARIDTTASGSAIAGSAIAGPAIGGSTLPESGPPVWQLNTRTWILTAPNGNAMLLKHAERLLLEALLSPAGEVLTKERVVQSQGAKPDAFDYRRVETLLRRLRIRCRDRLASELPVQTIYGRGLAFTEAGVVIRETGAPHVGRGR